MSNEELEIFKAIRHYQGIEYLLCSHGGQVLRHSPTAHRFIYDAPRQLANKQLMDLFDVFIGLEGELAQLSSSSPAHVKLNHVHRRFANGREGYLSFNVIPYGAALLVILADTTEEAKQQQRLHQKHNEAVLKHLIIDRESKRRNQSDGQSGRFQS